MLSEFLDSRLALVVLQYLLGKYENMKGIELAALALVVRGAALKVRKRSVTEINCWGDCSVPKYVKKAFGL